MTKKFALLCCSASGITEGDNARIGYRFWYNDGSQNVLLSTQYFRYKDVHPSTGTALKLSEPSIPDMDYATWVRIFKGWSKTGFNDSDENLTNIAVLQAELESRPHTDYQEGTYVDVFANLKNVYYVTYVDINPNNVLSTEIVPVAETGATTFTVKGAELRPTIDSDTEHLGWYDINNPDTVYSPGQADVTLDSSLTLYPKVAGGYWLIFNDNDLVDDGNGNLVSGGASFTPPAFYLNAETLEPAAPTWTGYEFGGWYTDAACTTPFTFGGMLNHDTTVYAKWTPSDSSYRVIIWKQRTSDAAGISDAEKTYDYVDSELFDQNVVTGQTVTLENRFKNIYGSNGTSSDADKAYFIYNAASTDQSVIVRADGTSVLNVYYDRKPVTLNYYTWDYEYTATADTSGTQYGLVDGNYVALTREGTNPNYVWTYGTGEYEYQYTATTSTSNNTTQYGLVNGQYVQLTRHSRNYYYYWTYGNNTTYTGTRYIRTYSEIRKTYTGARYSRSGSKSWRIYKSFTGLYGSTLDENGYIWPEEYNWYSNGHGSGGNAESGWWSGYADGDTSGTRTTFMSAFLPTETDTSGSSITVNFYGANSTGNTYIHFLVQNEDGTYTEKDTVTAGSGSFYISDKYIGYHASQYRADNGNWQSAGTKNSSGYYNNGNSVSYNNNLYIRFDRNDYTLTFYTNNGSNQLIPYTIPYDVSVADHASQSPGQREGYYFLGWFADPGCTEPFDFSQPMPDTNVAVYGKWKKRRVRVVVEPGANSVYMGSQAKTFRVDYDENVDGGLMETAARAGYILDGWYTDPEFTNRFLFSNPINDDIEDIDWTYQTNSQYAALRELYGDNTEAQENVRGILHLYAKWIPDTSSRGINVEYDAGDAAIYDSLGNLLTTVPVDPHMYAEDGTSTAREAPSNYSDLYTFKYWEATLRDQTTTIFHPSDPIDLSALAPTSTVYDEDTGEELRHTVTLRAVYELTGDPARQTFIVYDGNTFSSDLYPSGTETLRGRTADGTNRQTVTLDKEVNQTIELPGADDFYLDGWELVGWSFTEGTYEAQQDGADDLAPNFTPGQQVAADNLIISDLNDQGNTLYAMWQPKKYTVTVRQVVESGVPVNNFSYAYKTGVENQLSSLTEKTKSLTGNSSFTEEELEYYNRVGHVMQITPPSIPEDANYDVRVNAIVTRDDGTSETLNPTSLGNYPVLGDVVITYTYSLKVPITLHKRDATNHSKELTGASFVLTPVEFNTDTNHWENAGEGKTWNMTGADETKRFQEGTYRITEISAPTDYALIGTDLYLTIHKEGAFSLFSANGSAISANIAELDSTTHRILTVYDRPIRTVTLQKQVTNEEDPTTAFIFTVIVQDENNQPARNYNVGAGTTNNIGQLTLSLHHNETADIRIPYEYRLQVTETANALYDTSYAWISGSQTAEGTYTFGAETILQDGTLTYTNAKKYALTLEKQVAGGYGNPQYPFGFQAQISGAAAGTRFAVQLHGGTVYEVSTDSEGVLPSFTLKDGETYVVYLSLNQHVTLTETIDAESGRYWTYWDNGTVDTKTFDVTMAQDRRVVVTNELPPVAPTGYEARLAPYGLMLLCGAALLMLLRRRKGGGADA